MTVGFVREERSRSQCVSVRASRAEYDGMNGSPGRWMQVFGEIVEQDGDEGSISSRLPGGLA